MSGAVPATPADRPEIVALRTRVFVDEQGVLTRTAYGVKAKGHVAKLRRDLGIG